MPKAPPRIGQFFIQVSGNDIAPEVMDQLDDAIIEDDLAQPAMFALRFNDPKLSLIDGTLFRLGSEVKLGAANTAGERKLILVGEVTALEPRLEQNHITVVVRGYDRSHRLHRGNKTRTFLKQSDDDIARQIARDNGLRADIEATNTRYDYLLQNNQTDMAFLRERAAHIGYQVGVDDRTLRFRRAEQAPPAATAQEWGAGLLSFRMRLTAVYQPNEVHVRGWDAQTKRAVVGKATRPEHASRVGDAKNGGAVAEQAFGSAATLIVTDQPVSDKNEATQMAQALLDQQTGDYLTAEGRCLGEPSIRAGRTIEIGNMGKRLSGTYFVTAARHEYTANEGYMTTFFVSGRRPTSLLASLQPETPRGDTCGVVIGVVTNINDPDNLGRVRVMFPWLDDQHETSWVRLALPGAGASRGWQVLPEVDDEVLVAFEHGDINRPFVLGGLWNGKDKPPVNAVQSGKVQQRIFKTRAGHSIAIHDDDNAGKIEIKTAKHTITLNDKEMGKIEITTGKQTLTLDNQATGKIVLESSGDIELKGAGGKLSITAQGVELSSNASLKVQANAMLDVQSSGITNIKGSLVNIN
jgi:uncharacterized protein involved in type VI secretion and phage assembly